MAANSLRVSLQGWARVAPGYPVSLRMARTLRICLAQGSSSLASVRSVVAKCEERKEYHGFTNDQNQAG